MRYLLELVDTFVLSSQNCGETTIDQCEDPQNLQNLFLSTSWSDKNTPEVPENTEESLLRIFYVKILPGNQ